MVSSFLRTSSGVISSFAFAVMIILFWPETSYFTFDSHMIRYGTQKNMSSTVTDHSHHHSLTKFSAL